MQDLFDDLVEEYRINQRASIGTVRSRLKLHLVPAFGSVRAAELSTSPGQGLHRKAAGSRGCECHGQSRTGICRTGAQACNAKPPAESAPPDPHSDAPGKQCSRRLPRRRRLPSAPSRTARLFKAAAGRRLPRWHASWRICSKLRWSEVDFGCNQIRLNPGTTKNKKGRTLPMYGHMRECLLKQKAIRDAKYPQCSLVFHHDGQPIVEIRKAWTSACKRAGCEGGHPFSRHEEISGPEYAARRSRGERRHADQRPPHQGHL